MSLTEFPFEYPFGVLVDFNARLRVLSDSEENILRILDLEERISEGLVWRLEKERCELLILRILNLLQARNSLIFLRSRYSDAADRQDTTAMENWRDLLRKAYHTQFLPALAMLTAPEPDGFRRTLFHPSLKEADRYVAMVRSQARGYLSGIGLDV